MAKKNVVISKVVSKNFLSDFLARFQNMVGNNLIPYENMISKGVFEIEEELKSRNIVLLWYRYEITQLTNGAIVIMLYGDKK